jgi:succinate dehydrogenase/fumarate reductase flavoprotein subunit
MTPILHYTMDGLEINSKSCIVDKTGKPNPGLFATVEVAGGVHGTNCLGGSSLLSCVSFGCVSGDSTAAYPLLTTLAAGQQAGGHLGTLVGQLSGLVICIDTYSTCSCMIPNSLHNMHQML